MLTGSPVLDVKHMNALLQRSRGLSPVRKDDRPTFLEVSGYPNYESVCSNLLRFFFDPAEPHNLGTLFLSALLKEDKLNYGRVSVKREVIVTSSRSNARIDLLISCESCLVVIENKIFHGVCNPFEEYAAFAERRANGRRVEKFLLVIKEPNDAPGFGFCVLTHDAFLKEVHKRLGEFSSVADAHYQVLLFEFINTMHNLQKARSTMKPEHLKFLREAKGEINKMLEFTDEFKKELRSRVLELVSCTEWRKYDNVKQFPPYNEEPGLYDILVHQIRLEDKVTVAVDATITAEGWEISVLPLSPSLDRCWLNHLLEKLQINFESEDGERLILQRLGYDEPLTCVQAVLLPVIDKIAQSTNLPI